MRSIPPMGCTKYYELSLAECPLQIAVQQCLPASTDFSWTIIDKFGHHYSGTVTSDATGTIEIPVDESFPAGLFMHFSGSFQLTVEQDGFPRPFNISEEEYDAIQLSFFKSIIA